MIAQTLFSSLHVSPLPSLSVSTHRASLPTPCYGTAETRPLKLLITRLLVLASVSLGLFFSKGPHPGLRAQWGLPLWVFLGPFI